MLARIEQEQRDFTYREYVTSSLRLAPQDKYLTLTYPELLRRNNNVDRRSGKEIIQDVMLRAGLHFKGE